MKNKTDTQVQRLTDLTEGLVFFFFLFLKSGYNNKSFNLPLQLTTLQEVHTLKASQRKTVLYIDSAKASKHISTVTNSLNSAIKSASCPRVWSSPALTAACRRSPFIPQMWTNDKTLTQNRPKYFKGNLLCFSIFFITGVHLQFSTKLHRLDQTHRRSRSSWQKVKSWETTSGFDSGVTRSDFGRFSCVCVCAGSDSLPISEQLPWQQKHERQQQLSCFCSSK